jgi:parallel beta-helix repeat protein
MKRKALAVGIILLFIGTSIIPSTAQNIEKPSLPTSRGDWLYVGGSGPGNYTRIQDAVDNASDGDTVFVYDDSSPYNETITVNKAITLQGENMYTTIIDQGYDNPDYLTIGSNYVTITGFTISNTSSVWLDDVSNIIIENCVFYHNAFGINLRGKAENNCIRNCSFRSNHMIGIQVSGWRMKNNVISYCDFFDNGENWEFTGAIRIWGARGVKIHHCNITHNTLGIILTGGYNAVQITSNNIVNNHINGYHAGVVFQTIFPLFCDARHNWWGTPQGPNINMTLFYADSDRTIRNVDGNETVLFYGWKGLFVGLTRIFPCLTEPVPDAGQHLYKETV